MCADIQRGVTDVEGLRIALREVRGRLKWHTFNVMADPRAAELRLAKIDELTQTVTVLEHLIAPR